MERSRSLNFHNDRGVITGLFQLAGFEVNDAALGAIVQPWRQVVMVNAPAPMPLKGSRPIVPPAKVATLVGKFPKSVFQAEREHVGQGGSPLGATT